MSGPRLFLHGPLDWTARITSLADGQVDEIVEIEETFPVDILDRPATLIWAGDVDVPAKRLLKLLHGVQGFDIQHGTTEETESWAQSTWAAQPVEEPAATQTGEAAAVGDDKPMGNETTEQEAVAINAFLIAPEGDYGDQLMALAGHGINCEIGRVPLNRPKIESSDHIYVWIPEGDEAAAYERIAGLIKEAMKKPVTSLSPLGWQDEIVADLPKASAAASTASPEPEPEPMLALPEPSEEVVSESDLTVVIGNYANRLRSMISVEQKRAPWEAESDLENPITGLMGTVKRWVKTSMTYRKGLADLKPWKDRKLPDGADTTHWETIHESIREQSEIVKQLLIDRQDVLRKFVSCQAVRDQSKVWTGVEEEARDFLTRRHYFKLLKEMLDAEKAPYDTEEAETGDEEGEGLLGFFKKSTKPKKDKATLEIEEAERAEQEKEWRAWRSIVADEYDNIRKDLIERFWVFYEAVAIDWSTSPKPSFAKDDKRRLLRCGLLGLQFSGLDGEQLERSRPIVQENKIDFTYANSEIHAMYFDEFLELFAEQEVAPSYDEELELNSRGAPEWKEARNLRKIASNKRFRKEYIQQIEVCKERSEKLKEELRGLDQKMKGADAKDKRALKALKDKHHLFKVRLGRTDEFETMLKKLIKAVPKPKPPKFDKEFPLEHWIKKEVKHLRSKTRLMNKIKDQNFTEALAEELRSPSAKPITPKDIAKDITETLERDIALCDHVLAPHKKRNNALIACIPPLVIITPGGGQDSVCLEPANDSGEGRIMVPTFIRGSAGLHDIMLNALSDYRWDTCMLTAGSEWVTSDTLVGAYSRCRWEYRNKEKDVREKALFYKEENDKKNFRRHYKLFEKSADEGGKMLFFKSRITYENLIKYFTLPEGVEKIERG